MGEHAVPAPRTKKKGEPDAPYRRPIELQVTTRLSATGRNRVKDPQPLAAGRTLGGRPRRLLVALRSYRKRRVMYGNDGSQPQAATSSSLGAPSATRLTKLASVCAH